MKKKFIGMFVCLLLITAVFPIAESLNIKVITSAVSNINPQSCRQTNWSEIQKLVSDSTNWDAFGSSVSLDGDTTLIGAFYDDENGVGSGAAYVFTRTGTTWTLQQKIFAGLGFGCSVSLSGDTALIGAPGDDNGIGSAYIFTRSGTTWTQQAKITRPGGKIAGPFGSSVSIYGNTALIGEFGDDNFKGSAYVFTRSGTTWTLQQKLLASDGAPEEWFGESISLYDNIALIGAPEDDSKGSAYIFTRSGTTWMQQAKLLASDGTTGDNFGFSVSISNDTAIIGTDGDDAHRGSAYVFTRTGTTWTQQAKLLASDGEEGDSFGCSLSISGDTALIGAFYDDENGVGSGAAYIFTRSGTTWTQQAKLLASDGTENEWFGYSVSLDNNTVIIGAPQSDSLPIPGCAYVFMREGENQPPNPPSITGPANGKIKVAIGYNFTTTDPEDDEISYYIDWGDGTNSGWIGPCPSGDKITVSHTWSKKGDYTIKAKAKDIYGNESDWGTLSVTMPLSYETPHFRFFEWLLERFPNAFPLLRHLFGY